MPTIELKFSDSRSLEAAQRLIEDTPHYCIFKSVVKEVLDEFTCPILQQKPLVITRIKEGHYYLVIHTCCDSFNTEMEEFLAAHQLTVMAND
jgi:hypothetical protein